MDSILKNDEMDVDDPDTVTVCRLCADTTSSKSFIPLYTEDKQEQLVVKQINRLVSNLISANDGLPQNVCLTCAQNVDKFYAFVSSIIETQNRLRRIMQLPEIKEMGSGEESPPISFLNDDNASPYALTRADDGPEINAIRDINIRLNGNSAFRPIRENENRMEERSLLVTNRFTSTKDNGAESYKNGPLYWTKLYRCSPCAIKFRSKEDCLRHISRSHRDSKKAASENTIFETLSPVANGKNGLNSDLREKPPDAKQSKIAQMKTPLVVLNRSVCALTQSAGFPSTTSSTTSCAGPNEMVRTPPSSKTVHTSKQQINSGDVQHAKKSTTSPPKTSTVRKTLLPSTSSSTSVATTSTTKSASSATAADAKDEPPKRQYPRNRKVLAIDGFYKEVQRRKTKYICDVCGRAMASKFVFVRHLHEHDWSDDEQIEDEKESKKRRLHEPRPKPGYCSSCKKLVPHISRHNMFHVIGDLEETHPDHVHLLEAA